MLQITIIQMIMLGGECDDHFSFPRRRFPFPNQPGAIGFVGESPFPAGLVGNSAFPFFPFAFPAFSESLDAPMVGESSRL